jgi:hypothetical protein
MKSNFSILNYKFHVHIKVSNYRRWIKDIEELQTVKVNIPLLADLNCNILKSVRFDYYYCYYYYFNKKIK